MTEDEFWRRLSTKRISLSRRNGKTFFSTSKGEELYEYDERAMSRFVRKFPKMSSKAWADMYDELIHRLMKLEMM